MARVALITNYGSAIVQMRGVLIAEMIRRGHKVTVCAPSEAEKERESLRQLGAELEILDGDRTGANPLADLRYIGAIRRIYRRLRPDAVLAFSSKPAIYSALAAVGRSKPDVYAVITGLGFAFTGSSFHHRALATVVSLLYRMAFMKCRRVFFQNPDDLSLFHGRGLLRRVDQGRVIEGDGVDLRHFQPTPLPHQRSFLIIARLLRDKGVGEYVEAARQVRRSYPDARFRVVGWFDKNPAAISEAEVQSWVREGTIEFLGFSADVRRELSLCDVYVLPSHREGLPRTTVEAMAMGRPIITTDVPGCRSTVVPGRNGWLVAVKNADELAAAMLAALNAPESLQQLGKESRVIAEQRFGTDLIVGSILVEMGLG